jgi:hypothetical protein
MLNNAQDNPFPNFKPEDYKHVSADTLNIFHTTYSMHEIEFIIKHFTISLTCLLTTQKLTTEFCKEYILREDEYYCLSEGDEYLTVDDIVQWQPHIKREELEESDED